MRSQSHWCVGDPQLLGGEVRRSLSGRVSAPCPAQKDAGAYTPALKGTGLIRY